MLRKYTQFFPAFCLMILIFSIVFSGCADSQSKETAKSDFVLNTVATITVYGDCDESIIDESFALCRKYEALLSRTLESSEIYKLNRREISAVSDETAQLISKGLYYGQLSGGKFDITIEPLSVLWDFSSGSPSVPLENVIAEAKKYVDYTAVKVVGNRIAFSSNYTRLDLGAIAKGYIADRVRDYLASQGVSKATINLGGNVVCIGGKTADSGFTVGIQRPFGEGSIARVEISDLSVVTSGTYERYFEENGKLYHHILNPKTGYPIENGLLSVTIVGADSCACDALSTTCFALGLKAGLELINSTPNTYAIFVTDDYKLHFSNDAETVLNIKA